MMRFLQADITSCHAGTRWCWQPEKTSSYRYHMILRGVVNDPYVATIYIKNQWRHSLLAAKYLQKVNGIIEFWPSSKSEWRHLLGIRYCKLYIGLNCVSFVIFFLPQKWMVPFIFYLNISTQSEWHHWLHHNELWMGQFTFSRCFGPLILYFKEKKNIPRTLTDKFFKFDFSFTLITFFQHC